VPAGTTVNWINEGSHFHSVAATDGTFASTTLAPGESFTVHFTVPGKYGYMCKQHARQGMFGTIEVT
jgi:plastocyanin